MKLWIFLLVAGCATLVTAQCPLCTTMKWGRCEQNDQSQCSCFLLVDDGRQQTIDCSTLVPKCFLMKAEMYRSRKGQSTRSIGGKPVETAFLDNDGIYDPECEADGRFRARQCNNTEECWCVNSAGVRRSDKGDKSINCTLLVETYWIRFQLTHQKVSGQINDKSLKNAFGAEMKSRYSLDPSSIDNLQYDPDARMIVIDVKKPKGDRTIDLGRMAYYMEKDVKVLPLFYNDSKKFITNVDGQNLGMDNILVYYVDEVAPTFTMKNLSGGIIAVIVVVVLLVAVGLLLLFLYRRQQKKKYKKTPQRELDNM